MIDSRKLEILELSRVEGANQLIQMSLKLLPSIFLNNQWITLLTVVVHMKCLGT